MDYVDPFHWENDDDGDALMEEPFIIPDAFPELGDDMFADGQDNVPSTEAQPLARYKPRARGSILMAGMIGLANGMGFQDHRDKTEIAIPFDNDQDGLDFNFGPLPPL